MSPSLRPPSRAPVPLQRVDALPEELAPNDDEWLRLLSLTRYEPPRSRSESPCTIWTGAKRFRFRGKLWIAERLFYALCQVNGAEELESKRRMLACDCLRKGCLVHTYLKDYRPPPPSKRKLPPVAEDDDDASISEPHTPIVSSDKFYDTPPEWLGSTSKRLRYS